MYKVEWSKKAQKDLKKIDPATAEKIRIGVENRLAKDPTRRGKPLVHNHKGKWRFRFSEYRVIYEIKEKKLFTVGNN